MRHKFRCWDAEQSRWLDPAYFSVTGDGKIHCIEGGLCLLSTEETAKRLILEQFTGQTDKNGTEEIYIGSQVEVTWDDGKKELYAIEWSDEWWGFCLDSGAKMPPSSQIEVIGTIHDKENDHEAM